MTGRRLVRSDIVRIAVLASGSGTLLEAILADGIPVELVVVDRPSRATEVAEQHGVAAVHVERTTFGEGFDRTGYTKQVVEVLEENAIDLIVMAGFGTVFAETIHDAFPHRIRSEERRVGTEWVGTCRSRWSPIQ